MLDSLRQGVVGCESREGKKPKMFLPFSFFSCCAFFPLCTAPLVAQNAVVLTFWVSLQGLACSSQAYLPCVEVGAEQQG